MGLKSGSRDAGLDESAENDEQAGEQTVDERAGEQTIDGRAAEQIVDEPDEGQQTPTATGSAQPNSQPQRQRQEGTEPPEQSHTQERKRTEKQTESQTETECRQRPTVESLPYKLRREKVNEGREQVPYFLREEVIDAESELQETLEEILGEKVYKSDYREAAMVVAQRNPALVAEVLREWGYDLRQL